MGQLIIPAEREVNGPWLLGKPELEELNDLFEFIDLELQRSLDFEIEEVANDNFKSGKGTNLELEKTRIKEQSFSRNTKKVTLISKDEKRLIDDSLKGILKDSKVNDFNPKELRLDIEHGRNNEFSLVIKKIFGGDLSYKVKCSSQDTQEEIRYKLDNFLDKNKPDKFKQVWSKYAFFFGLISFMLLLLSMYYYILKDINDVKSVYKSEINSIAQSGVNDSNQNKALELLLKYSIEYKPTNLKTSATFGKSFYKILAISLFVIFISILYPKTVIGLGRDRNLLKFYRIYTKFVLFTLPSIFIIPIIIDFIKGFLNT